MTSKRKNTQLHTDQSKKRRTFQDFKEHPITKSKTASNSEKFTAKMKSSNKRKEIISKSAVKLEHTKKPKLKKSIKQKATDLVLSDIKNSTHRLPGTNVSEEVQNKLAIKSDKGASSSSKEKVKSPMIKLSMQFPTNSNTVSANWKIMQKQICGTIDKKMSQKFLKEKNLLRNKRTENLKKRTKVVKPTDDSTAPRPEIWFDGVDPTLLGFVADTSTTELLKEDNMIKDDTSSNLVKQHSFQGVTRAVAMDCEMVGVGEDGKESILARVSLVNNFGNCIYDKFVQPREKVTDYRTHVSGVRQQDLKTAEDFSVIQKEVADILDGRMLVGHALHNDLQVLYLTHPRGMIRDTQSYKPFRALFNGGRPGLRKLCDKVMGVQVQQGEHSSVQDAQAAMRLYTMYKKDWEKEIKQKPQSGKRKRNNPHKMKKKQKLTLDLDD